VRHGFDLSRHGRAKHLLANVRARGAELRAGLKKLAAKFDFIREVRGEGLMLGVGLDVEALPTLPRPSSRACSSTARTNIPSPAAAIHIDRTAGEGRTF